MCIVLKQHYLLLTYTTAKNKTQEKDEQDQEDEQCSDRSTIIFEWQIYNTTDINSVCQKLTVSTDVDEMIVDAKPFRTDNHIVMLSSTKLTIDTQFSLDIEWLHNVDIMTVLYSSNKIDQELVKDMHWHRSDLILDVVQTHSFFDSYLTHMLLYKHQTSTNSMCKRNISLYTSSVSWSVDDASIFNPLVIDNSRSIEIRKVFAGCHFAEGGALLLQLESLQTNPNMDKAVSILIQSNFSNKTIYLFLSNCRL